MEKWLWLLFVELWAFLSPKFALLKWAWQNASLPQQLECRCGPTATVTSLKVTWNEGPDQALQGKRLSSRNYAALRNVAAHFQNLKNGSFFCILAKGWPHEIFWKASHLEMAKSDIFYVKWGADEDGAMEKWLWLLFVELWAFLSLQTCPPKWAWKSAFYRKKCVPMPLIKGQRPLWGHWKLLERGDPMKVLIKHFKENSYEQFFLPNLPSKMGFKKVLFNVIIWTPLRANGDCDVTESYLEWTSWLSTLRKAA